MAKNRIQTVLALLVFGVGLLVAGILGLWGYMSVTATPIHPTLEDVPIVTSTAAAPRWTAAAEQGRQIVRAALVEQNLPALSIAVGAGDDVVWAEGVGWADLENRVRVGPDMRFRIGTASKVLTSAAVGLLLEQGRLTLDDKIQTLVSEFPEKQWPVTLRQLMGHVSGVRRDNGDEEPLTVHCGRTLDGLQRFADGPLLFEPGTQYRYSTYGWILVSAAVEAAADQPFVAFMRKHVFEPLGMSDTSADAPSEPMSERATFYFPKFAADPRYGPQPPSEVDYSCFSGSSAFLTTPSDLVRFGLAINRGRLLQPATVQLLQTSLRLPSGEETGYGLGWDLETVEIAGEQTRVVGHDGEMMDGTVASFFIVPQRGIVVAVTSNTAYAETFPLAVKVAQAFVEQDKGPARK